MALFILLRKKLLTSLSGPPGPRYSNFTHKKAFFGTLFLCGEMDSDGFLFTTFAQQNTI